jgi:hypothetical protein
MNSAVHAIARSGAIDARAIVPRDGNDGGTSAMGETAPSFFSKIGERDKKDDDGISPPDRVDRSSSQRDKRHPISVGSPVAAPPTTNDSRHFNNGKWNAATVALFLPFDFLSVVTPYGGKDGGARCVVCRRSFVVRHPRPSCGARMPSPRPPTGEGGVGAPKAAVVGILANPPSLHRHQRLCHRRRVARGCAQGSVTWR